VNPEHPAAMTGGDVLPVVFACSPRKGGNSDHAALGFAQGIRDAGGDCQMIILREHRIFPCQGCSACARTGQCVLAHEDDVAGLFDLLMRAPFIFFASPIYFYHLPAMFKGFIDRGQSYYMRVLNQDAQMLALPSRRAYMAFCAGRPRGDRLFEGSLLSMKYFLKIFQCTLHEHLGFHGKDGPEDFLKDPEACAMVRTMGADAWKAYYDARA